MPGGDTNAVVSAALGTPGYATPNGSPAVQAQGANPEPFGKTEGSVPPMGIPISGTGSESQPDVKVPINSLGGPNGSPVINHDSEPPKPAAPANSRPTTNVAGFNQVSGQNNRSNDGKTNNNASATNPAPPKKRTRATPEQLAVLEETFITNTSPNSKLREQLSRRLGMSERSIQIWFQNRRAKVKMMHKRSCQMQEEALRAQMAMMPHYLYRYGYPPSAPGARLPLPRQGGLPPHPGMTPPGMHLGPPPPRPGMPPMMDPTGRPGWLSQSTTPVGSPMHPAQPPPGYPSPLFTAQTGPQGPQSATSAPQTPSSGGTGGPRSAGAILPAPGATPVAFPGAPDYTQAATQAAQLACEALSIGTWRRVALGSSDLRCFCDFVEKKLVWFISDNSINFKMEFPIAVITGIDLSIAENAPSALLTVDLSQPPSFFMEVRVNNTTAWQMCRDFTESKQASTVMRHVLRGNHQLLRSQLLSIVDCEKSLGTLTVIDGTPYDPSNPVFAAPRKQSGPAIPNIAVDVTAQVGKSMSTSAGTPPPRTSSGLTPKRSSSVPMLSAFRPLPDGSQTSSPAGTPLAGTPMGTPVSRDQTQPTSFGGSAASQFFQMNNGIRQSESPMLGMSNPLPGLPLGTPPSITQDPQSGTLGVPMPVVTQCGTPAHSSPLDHHSLPPAAFANAPPISLPPPPGGDFGYTFDRDSNPGMYDNPHPVVS